MTKHVRSAAGEVSEMKGRRRSPDARVVVITGASSGLGRATAHAFAATGASVVLIARGAEALAAVASECVERGGRALVVVADVADADAVTMAANAAIEHFGHIDVWVDAAAAVAAGPLHHTPPIELERVARTNFLGVLLTSAEALRRFDIQDRGTLILVSSLLGLVPNPIVPTYVMSKFAVRGLGLSLRQALRDRPHIAVGIVLPGPMDARYSPIGRRASRASPECRWATIGREHHRAVLVHVGMLDQIGRRARRETPRQPSVVRRRCRPDRSGPGTTFVMALRLPRCSRVDVRILEDPTTPWPQS